MRKAIFTHLTPPQKTETPAPRRPLLGAMGLIPDAPPVGAVGQSLNEASARAKRADEIERKLIEGETIVELDPALIDPSFVADRMPLTSEGLKTLREQIENHGQLNPILVRPHPDGQGRYQVAFGHRRLSAIRAIGRNVRAVVRKLSDEELVIAQGQENHERQDLSYIEKALFARRLENRGFARATIMSALCVHKSDLSNMLSVASKIPEGVIAAIGPAPGTGRRGWIELAQAAKGRAVEKAIAAPDFESLTSDDRFKAVLRAVRPSEPRKPKPKTEILSSSRGKILGRIVQDDAQISLAIDRREAPEFAEFVLKRLRDIHREFESGRR